MIETLWCQACNKLHIIQHGIVACDSVPRGTTVLIDDTQKKTWCRNFDVGTFSTTESGWAALKQCIVTDHYREFKRFERTRKLFNRMLADSLWISDMR